MKKSILLSVVATVVLMLSMAASAADHFKPEGFGSIPAVQATTSKASYAGAPTAEVAVQAIKTTARDTWLIGAARSESSSMRSSPTMTSAAHPSLTLKQPCTRADREAEGRERGEATI